MISLAQGNVAARYDGFGENVLDIEGAECHLRLKALTNDVAGTLLHEIREPLTGMRNCRSHPQDHDHQNGCECRDTP